MKKKNSGITLVALVITIIVLIILAGVSINSVMNGGLIDNAKVARDEFEDAKYADEGELQVLEGHIQEVAMKKALEEANTTDITHANGMVTGIAGEENVKTLKDKLPSDIIIRTSEGGTIDNLEGTTLKTGMQIVKDGNIISRVVIYGDVDGTGVIDGNDAIIAMKADKKDFTDNWKKTAADVNFDGFINLEDANILLKISGGSSYEINKSIQPQDGAKIVLETTEKYYGRQIDNLGISDKIIKKEWYAYTYYDEENEEYVTEGEYYKIYIQPNTLTVGECKSKNTEDGTYKMSVTGKTDETAYIGNGDILKLAIKHNGLTSFPQTQIAEFIISE